MKKNLLRKSFLACALAVAAFATDLPAAAITSFDDIELWFGSGSNQSAIVIDWNDGTASDSFAWGFRWDGAATGQDLFIAIAGQYSFASSPSTPGAPTPVGFGDIALSLYVLGYSFGDSVDRISYTDSTGSLHDQNSEAFNNGFWSYWIAEGSGEYPASWDESMVGFGDRALSNGSWDGYSFVPDFNGLPPSAAIAAVPEPTSITLLVGAFIGIAIYFVRRRRAA